MDTEVTKTNSHARAEWQEKIKRLQGPILVLGGSGFIGANLFRALHGQRDDVYATTSRLPAWRLEDISGKQIRVVDLLVESNLDALLDEIRPRTIFDCIAYGAYSFEVDSRLIYQTNFDFQTRLLPRLERSGISAYVHAGTSSEYGDNAAAPRETDTLAPNSDYAVSKAATAGLIYYYGKKKRLPCANLRLYSVYGPLEDSSRLIPNLISHAVSGRLPDFVRADISRDFVYIDDACEAFIDAALKLRVEDYGLSFNIGTGTRTTMSDLAVMTKQLFSIAGDPVFTMPARSWDVSDWFADTSRAHSTLGWEPRTALASGLCCTAEWYRALPDKDAYYRSSKKFGLDIEHSVSAVIACYKDNEAIPIAYRRLKETFARLNIDHEIIFVNDCSPDDTEEVIRSISRDDPKVTGISHSRNFGSQSAFRSGMELASKNAVVLLDGDLQDPPELIEQFVDLWRKGYDVVYGRRVKREAPFFMRVAYKLFYRMFDAFSYLSIPHDAGDFALLDKRVVDAMLRFPERDLFLRGVRAYAGFKQIGIDYVRPERMFGVTTNNIFKNIGWAKKGILAFSNVPLNILSSFGLILLLISFLLGILQIIGRLLFAQQVPSGTTTVLLVILFFGSLNLFAISLVGEYIAKIFEEVKQRPHYIRRSIIKEGEVRPVSNGE